MFTDRNHRYDEKLTEALAVASLPRRHLAGIDVMRIVALAGVLGLHATAYVLAAHASAVKPTTLTILGFWFLAAVNQFGRFSVPAFYFIAGYLLAYNNHSKLVLQRDFVRNCDNSRSKPCRQENN